MGKGISLREELIGDIADGDLTPRKGIGAPDRIGALARSSTLASAIKRLQAVTTHHAKSKASAGYAHALYATIDALDATLCRLKNSKALALKPRSRVRVCYMVVLEAAYPLCVVCKGRREVRPKGGAVIQCEACNGSGVRRYTDEDRIRVMGRVLTADEEDIVAEAHSILSRHEVFGEQIVVEQLYGDE